MFPDLQRRRYIASMQPFPGRVSSINGNLLIRSALLGTPSRNLRGMVDQLSSEHGELGASVVGCGLPPKAVVELQENDARAEYRQHSIKGEVGDGTVGEMQIGRKNLLATPKPGLRGG